MAFGQHRARKWRQNNALLTWISLLGSMVHLIRGSAQVPSDVFPEFTEQPQSQVLSHHAPVTLRCAASPDDAQIRWLFNGQPLDERRHAGLQLEGSNLHFPLAHPRQERKDPQSNLGEYRCTATTSLGTVISQPATLSKPVLATFPQSPDVRAVVPEGGYATLTCDLPESNPAATVIFQTTRGDTVDTSKGTVHVLPSGNLVITNITSGSGAVDYRCVAVNPLTGHNTTSVRTISVQVGRAGTSVKLMPGMKRRVQVAMGADVSLECPSYGHPGGNISWSKIGGSLPIGRFNLTDFGNINIESVQYDDTGTYRCQSSTGSDQVVLEVFTIPVVQVVRQPGKSVHVGDRVEFVCSYGGLPKPTLRWYHNGRELSSSSEGNLVLSKVSTADSGIYQCMASNILGTKYGVLSLLVNPQARVIKTTVAPHTELVTVNATEHQQHKVENGRRDRKKNGRRKSANLRDKKKKKKTGKGHPGEAEKPKYAPSVPTVNQLSDKSVMLNWSVSDFGNGQTIKFFKVQYKEMHIDENKWLTPDAILAPETRRFEVVNLKIGAAYKFRICAVFEDDDNRNSASTKIFKLKMEPHTQPRPPEIAPMIVEVSPLEFQGNYALGVKWQFKPETSPPIEGFIIYYKPYGTDLPDTEKRVPGASVSSEVIRDLAPNTDYSIRMHSFNMAGVSQASNLVVKTTKSKGSTAAIEQTEIVPPPEEPEGTTEAPIADRRSSEALEQPVILGIVLGALLLALLVLVTMCWWKQRQQKRRNLCNNAAQQKFQDQSRCIFADGGLSSKPSGNLYPSNGSIPVGNGHGPPHDMRGQMNIDVNPLAEYDVQTNVHGDGRPKQFYGNNGVGGVTGVLPRCNGDKMCKEMSCQHSGNSHGSCNGDMSYMEYSKPMYPMQHRTLPLTPNQPLHSFYSEAGSLGRPINHEYSEPGDHERMHSSVIPHALFNKQNMGHPGLMNGQVRNFNWPRAYDQPCMDKSSHVSMDRLSPCYPAPADFAGGHSMFAQQQQHKRHLPVSPSAHLPSFTAGGPGPLRGNLAGLHGNGKHKRRRKRPTVRELVHDMKDQATNTDLSSSAYCHSGSSSGSDVCSKHCDSSFANNGSLESLEDDDSQSAISSASHEEPLAILPSQCDIMNR